MFLDESGDHNLTTIDPQFPMFALAGCVFDRDYYQQFVIPRVRQYKIELFGTEDIVLHTADISRNKNGFELLKDEHVRSLFYKQTNTLYEELNFTLIAVTLDKVAHLQRNSQPEHPYDYCFTCLLERFVWLLEQTDESGEILAESRNRLFDRELNGTFEGLLAHGTDLVAPNRFRRILDLKFAPKSANDAGLQIADLSVTPVARYALGRNIHPDMNIILTKFRRDAGGSFHEYGFKMLP